MLQDHFPVLESKRLTLRPLQQSDAAAYIEIMSFSEKEANLETAKEKIEEHRKLFEKKDSLTWAIEYKGQLVGTIGYYRGFKYQTGEIGYVIRDAFKRRGIMFEAARMAIKFGFHEIGNIRITAYTQASNLPSVAMLKKLGFQNSGKKQDKYTIFELWKEDWEF